MTNSCFKPLESKQYGKPLALGVVVREALTGKDLMPLSEFLAAKESVYHNPWSLWGVATWAFRQVGAADLLRGDKLPHGQFVVLANVEEMAKAFSEKNIVESRLERTFSKAHFQKTFAGQLVEGKQASETDVEVLLRYLSRDKEVVLYDGNTVKILAPGESQRTISEEDASIAQLRELIEYLNHQASILSTRGRRAQCRCKDSRGEEKPPCGPRVPQI